MMRNSQIESEEHANSNKANARILPLFKVAGKWLSASLRPKKKHRLFLFPSAANESDVTDIPDISRLFPDMDPVIILTDRDHRKRFGEPRGSAQTTIWDISEKIRNPIMKSVYAGVIVKWINDADTQVAIGEKSFFFYSLLPFLNGQNKTIDIIHDKRWLSISQSYISRVGKRVFSSERLMKEAKRLHGENGTDFSSGKRWRYIDHTTSSPGEPVFTGNEQLEVVFISKGVSDERTHLVAEAAKMLHKKGIAARISFIGDVKEVIDQSSYPYCTFYGNTDDGNKISRILRESDVLLLTSKSANYSKLVMDMMALGKVVVSIENDSVQDYIKDGVNGYLIKEYEKESNIIDDFHISLSILAADRANLIKMGNRGWKMARERLNENVFFEKWKEIID